MTSDNLRETDRTKQLDVLIQVMDEWRKLSPELTVNALLSFLVASRHEGDWNLTEIAARYDMTLSTAGRSLQAFEAVNRLKKPGLGLIEKKHDPYKDSRSDSLHLTTAGRQFLRRVLAPLQRLAA